MSKKQEETIEENTEQEGVIETPQKEVVEKKDLAKSEQEQAQQLGLVLPKNMGDMVTNTMQKYIERGLIVPKDYNVENAVISSYLMISQNDKLKNCDPTSIGGALIDMATLGLNATKQQGYFIPYGGKLTFSPSYFGKITALKRIKGVIDVVADIIYKGTEYELVVNEYGTDEINILKPCPLEERKQENIVGVWASILLDEEVFGRTKHSTIMTMDEVKASWNQGQMKGNSPAHKNFMGEMAKKSVINRCVKNFVNSAVDQDIYLETYAKTVRNDYLDDDDNIKNSSKERRVIDI